MLLLPLVYLKNKKAIRPPETNPAWFNEDPVALSKILAEQGAQVLYINDLNIPATGRSENLPVVEKIIKNTNLKVWVAGSFRSTTTLESYSEIGVDKMVVSNLAYENPDLLKQETKHFNKKIAATIEVRNKRVVIPGMAASAHKTALDYAERFEEAGVAAIVYQDSDPEGIKEFCNHVHLPVISLNDVQTLQELEILFDCEAAGLAGVVLGKSLYENRIDLHGAMAFLDDLAATLAREPTLTEE